MATTEHAHHEPDHADHHHGGGALGGRAEIVLAVGCGALLLAAWLCERRFGLGAITYALYGLSYVAGGFYTVREAWENVRARRLKIDSLMIVAAAGAAVLGEWAEGALLLFLFSLGHALEHYAMGRAKRAIEARAELAPRTAMVRRPDGGTSDTSLTALSSIGRAPASRSAFKIDSCDVADRSNSTRTRPDTLASASRTPGRPHSRSPSVRARR